MYLKCVFNERHVVLWAAVRDAAFTVRSTSRRHSSALVLIAVRNSSTRHFLAEQLVNILKHSSLNDSAIHSNQSCSRRRAEGCQFQFSTRSTTVQSASTLDC